MKTIKIVITSVVLSCSFVAFAQENDKVIENTRKALETMLDASKEYNKAFEDTQNASKVLSADFLRAKDILDTFSENKNSLYFLSKRMDEISLKMKSLEESFKDNENNLKYAGDNLETALQSLPLGEGRFELAQTLYVKGDEIVSKNPGKNYEDKRYFDNTWAYYVSAKNKFLNTQKEVKKMALNASIGNPRINGIKSVLELVKDLEKKSLTIISDAQKDVDSLGKSVQSGYENVLALSSKLGEKNKILAKANSDYAKANFALSSFIMNELPKNEKYFKLTFADKTGHLNALASSASMGALPFAKALNFESLDTVDGFGGGSTYANKAKAGSAPMLNRRAPQTMEAAISDSMALNQKDLRSEVLDIVVQLRNLTTEILRADKFLNEIISEARCNLSNLETLETSSNNLLRDAISNFSAAQIRFSEIQIFKNSLKVAQSQSQVADGEFKKLSESSDASIKIFYEKLEGGSSYILKAKKLLK